MINGRGAGGEDEGIPLEDIEKKSSLLGAYANLCNITIGAGIVGLPYAIKEAGLLAGTIMIVVCAFLTDYSLRMVISIGKLANVNSYETLCEASFGRAGFLFVSLSMFFLSYGSMVAYLIIIKDTLPVLFGVDREDIDSKRVIMLVSSLLIILPLSMQRDMANLEKTSSLNVLINICLVALVVGFSPVKESVDAQGGILQMIVDEPFLDFSTFFVGFGVCSFAFVCQDSSFIIAGSMKTPSKQRWKRVTNAAMLTCCTLELTLGVAGYLSYQSHTLGNVLNNMSTQHWSGVLCRAMLSTTMFFAYPMNLYVARHAFIVLFFKGNMAHAGDDSSVLMRRDRIIVLTCAIYILSLIPAMLMNSTGKVLAITGAIAGSSLAYVVPGLTFFAIRGDVFLELIHKRWGRAHQLWGFPVNFIAKNEAGLPTERAINQNPVAKTSTLDSFLWYALCMPIWSAIAQFGQTKLAEHFEQEEMMSPSVVKPKRVTLAIPPYHHTVSSNDRNANSTERTMLLKSNPGHPYGANAVVGNAGVAKMIASKIKVNGSSLPRTNSLSSVEIEMELQKDVPTWKDFYIAAVYICLGAVAMIFGLISILLM